MSWFDAIVNNLGASAAPSQAKEAALAVLNDNKLLFVEGAQVYVGSAVALFNREEEVDSAEYESFVSSLEQEALLEEIDRVASEIESAGASLESKRKFIQDLKALGFSLARKALIAAITAA